MRKKPAKVDHHVQPDVYIAEDFSDYDSSPLSDDHSSVDVDVKEALRSSISLKSKLQQRITTNQYAHSMSTHHHDNHDDDDDEEDALMLDSRPTSLDLKTTSKHSQKEKKPKKPEDVETATMRRERNRLAAQRCRQRRRDRIDKLEKVCDKLQSEGDKLQTEISDLQTEMNHLQKILDNHKCMALPTRLKSDNYAFVMKYEPS